MHETHTPRAQLRGGRRHSWGLPTTALPFVVVVAAVLVGAALATAVPVVRSVDATDDTGLPDADLFGYWYTVANGDRVRSVLREDDVVWSATEGGGVVRWSLSDGTFRQYLAPQDGLPSNDVRALWRDGHGTLYAGTSRGLATLAPTDSIWRRVPMTDPQIQSPRVTAMAPDDAGALWVGFEQTWDPAAPHPVSGKGAFVGGGVARFQPDTGAWGPVVHAELTTEPSDRPLGLPSENVTSVTVGSNGLVWVGMRPYYRWRDDVCGRPNCPPEQSAWAPDGGGLAATDDTARGWRHWNSQVASSCEASTDQIVALLADDDGRVWVGSRGRGLQLFMGGLGTRLCDADTGHRYWETQRDGLPGSQVWSLAAGAPGSREIWMGVGDGDRGLGVAVLDHGGTFERPEQPSDDVWVHHELFGYVGKHDAIPASITVSGSPEVRSLVIGTRDDRMGDGWGVLVHDLEAYSRAWRALATANTGPPSNQITAVADDPNTGDVWFGTRNRGVARWDGSTWSSWGAFDAGDAAGQMLDPGIRASETITLTQSTTEYEELFPGPLRLMRVEHDRTLYELGPARAVEGGVRASVRPKLQKTYPSGTGVYNVQRGPAGDAVTSIMVDDRGSTWVGAMPSTLRPPPPSSGQTFCETYPDCWYDGGVGLFDDASWTTFNPEPAGGRPIRDVLALAADASGNVWVGTGDPGTDFGQGVAIFEPENGTWDVRSRATEGSDFGGDVVTGVAVDSLTGDVWLSTHHNRCAPGSPDCGSNGREGGGVSRWDGRGWTKWVQDDDSSLEANGTDGNFTSIAFDSRRARVWAGAWAEGPEGAHWISGRGIDAAANSCSRNCDDMAWASRVFRDEGAVHALDLDGSGNLWLGSSRENRGAVPHAGGVKLYDGDQWTRQPTDLWSNEVTALAREGDGMWVGTYDGGAARWRPAVLTAGAFLPVLRR